MVCYPRSIEAVSLARRTRLKRAAVETAQMDKGMEVFPNILIPLTGVALKNG
jgi:hypothetical protein